MKYLLLDNPAGADGRFNVGDDIQSIAAANLMPRVDNLIIKEEISKYTGKRGRLLLNGWFMHHPENWPPPDTVDPLAISMHVNNVVARQMLSGKGKDFFLKHGPIGCRDKTTQALLSEAGVPAYLSGCITLTLDRNKFLEPQADQSRSGVVIVDPLYKLAPAVGFRETMFRFCKGQWNASNNFRKTKKYLVEQIVGPDLLPEVTYETHSCSVGNNSHQLRKRAAQRLLSIYARARLVVTSRIHCALPCLAFGTPVLFVDSGLEKSSERARLDGLVDLFHCVKFDPDTGSMELPIGYGPGDYNKVLRNKTTYLSYRDALLNRSESFFASPNCSK